MYTVNRIPFDVNVVLPIRIRGLLIVSTYSYCWYIFANAHKFHPCAYTEINQKILWLSQVGEKASGP